MYQVIVKGTKASDNNSKTLANLVGAVGGITSGLILLLTGIILSVISYFNRESFRGLEVVLIVAAFVLLAVGAHFLDRLEGEKKAARIEHCRRSGLTDKQCD